MQAAARSRSPRGRSRSNSPRRQWNEEGTMVHPSLGIRGARVPWKTEIQVDDARLPQVDGIYSTQSHRTIIREDLSIPVAGKSPIFGPDGVPIGSTDSAWEKMMTFRTFVIDRMSEETDSESAVNSYREYRENFRRSYTGRLFKQLKDLPVLSEKYDPQFVLKQFEESQQRCRLAASEFMKLLAEERFQHIALVEPARDARSIAATSKPFRLLVGTEIVQDPSFAPLTDPFFVPEDPDYFCLCLRNVPSHISKWDVLEHLTSLGAIEGLVDLTLTVPDGTQLTSTSANKLTRTAWIKYNSDDSCAASEIKLEGTNFKRFTCRPIRRVPDLASYTFRIAPSETCHPARVSRDLRLSARLIVKLDDTFGVSELLGVSINESEKEILNEARCQQHPVLFELPNVLQGVPGRTPCEQLDLQILYLRVVHCTCYYSGRRFYTPREVWDVVGPLYVRPNVLPEEVLSLQGFSKNGEIGDWDPVYIAASDVFHKLQQNKSQINEVNAYDDHEYFLKDETPDNCFEPSKSTPVVMLKYEQSISDISLVKVEDINTTMDSTMIDSAIAGATTIQIHDDDDECKPVVIKAENDPSISRGRQSAWLAVLDARITRLLREEFHISTIDETNEEVAGQWAEFCNKNMNEVEADKWRCSLCKKLFRGADFVQKHLRNKHGASLTPIIDQVKLKHMILVHQQDPNRIPISPPKPTPYLYRTAFLKQQRRQESPALGPVGTIGVPSSLNLPCAPIFPPYIPNTGGARLGPRNQGPYEYRDLDAPKPIATANGNLRAAIQYDDL